MGVYRRADSPYWWMALERPARRPRLCSTKIPVEAYSAALRKQQRQDADDVYAAAMADLARDRHGLPTHDTRTIAFAAYLDWWTIHQLPHRRGKDREVVALDHLREFFGARDLATLDRALVQEYITQRLAAPIRRTTRTVTPSTVNREVDVLKALLRDAVPTYLKASPLAGMPKLRTVAPRKAMLRPDEEARLLAELPPRDQVFVLVALDTLLRLSNVLALRWEDHHGTYLELRDSKTGPYAVPLSDRAQRALATLPRTDAYIFPHRRQATNPRDWRGAVRLMLKRACARAHVPYGRGVGITFHTGTRATGATRMLRAQVDLRTVQAVGNWKDVRAMQAYLQTDSPTMQSAVNTIGGAAAAPKKSRKPSTSRLRTLRDTGSDP